MTPAIRNRTSGRQAAAHTRRSEKDRARSPWGLEEEDRRGREGRGAVEAGGGAAAAHGKNPPPPVAGGVSSRSRTGTARLLVQLRASSAKNKQKAEGPRPSRFPQIGEHFSLPLNRFPIPTHTTKHVQEIFSTVGRQVHSFTGASSAPFSHIIPPPNRFSNSPSNFPSPTALQPARPAPR